MTIMRKVEIFSAGCAVCDTAIDLVQKAASQSCKVVVQDMQDIQVAARASALGIRSVPAVVVDGQLVSCCASRGIDESSLRAAIPVTGL